MKIGISGLAVANSTGLGRLNRICIVALAEAAANCEIHVYLRSRDHLDLILGECDRQGRRRCEKIITHYAPSTVINRLLLEEWDLPRQFGPLGLDSYLGCDFTLPGSPVAGNEAVVIPDLLPFTKPYTVGWRARWLYRRGIKRSVARANSLVCISQATIDALTTRFRDTPKTKLVYPAVSPILWRHSRDLSADHALQIRGSLATVIHPGPYILCVGAAGRRKNTDLLVQLHRRLVLHGAYRGSLIIVGGDGRFHTAPRTEHLLAPETAGTPPRNHSTSAEVFDIGRVSDHELSQLYASADLLANLSSEEGFGFPVVESLVHGTPAFVTAGTSMEEIASAGIISTPLNSNKCYDRLKSVVGSLELLRREVLSLDLSVYSVERMGRDLKEILEVD